MNIIVYLLVIIIFIFIIYLFLMKREIKRISHSLRKILKSDSNNLLHSELPNKELNKLLLEINKMLTFIKNKEHDLEKRNNYLKKEILNITHDLRTPLTSAIGYIDLIMNSNLSKEEQEKELKIIENRLLRLEELVSSFFEFLMVTNANKSISMKEINIIAIIEECISHYYDDFTNQKRKIIFENSMKRCLILSSEELLKRIVDNLIGNSLKHGKSDLVIKISKGSNIKLLFENEMVDTNIDVSHIFDEFYTSDISRNKGNTGLGLAIVKEFVSELKGSISAQKKENKLKIIIKF